MVGFIVACPRSVVADYIEQQQENGRTWIPALLVEALKIGARMDELLRRVDAEKCARISSVDTTMRRQGIARFDAC